MKKVIKLIEDLKKSKVSEIIKKRIKEFEELGVKSNEELFKELCFCILTANFSASRAIEIKDKIGDGFLYLNQRELSNKLRKFGHRFPNMRSKFIVESRTHKNKLKEILEPLDRENKIRDWLVKEIKGYGMKEASHFMRNIGKKNVAIIDFHILDFLINHKILSLPVSKTISKSTYLKIEKKLLSLAKKVNLNLAELDLYLWYCETGKVLK